MRVAYITPYYKEEPDVLERCIKSVEAQTIKVDHFLVSDGYPDRKSTRLNSSHLA